MPGILVVEDDENLNRGITFSLKKSGYEVFSAESVKKAKRIASDNNVDVTICDVNLPDGNGLEFVRWMRCNYNTYIICLTALDQEIDQVMGYEAGADDYITKPFNLEILLLRIRKLLMWTLKNHDKFKTRDISPSEITISSLDEQLIEKAIRIVEENMDNSEFSVEELSAQIGMSRSGLYKKLMQITGKSPLEFMRILRLKRGRKLLEGSQMNISQISYQVGLSPKQFAKFFKEEFGYLPSEYKKKEEK